MAESNRECRQIDRSGRQCLACAGAISRGRGVDEGSQPLKSIEQRSSSARAMEMQAIVYQERGG